MKTKITFAILSVFLTVAVFAQGKASVYATNSDISDNLDLKAVASIFGDSKDLADFEYRLNDPNTQISNLDLNNDNMVDYLRVIEMVQDNSHLVVLQAVLQEDVYQDVATIVVSKRKNRQVNIQIIGDPYMYGTNYIYEPIYVVRPTLYSNFWVTNYRPYRSYYGWNRYPTFYTPWNTYAYGDYHRNVYLHINHNNYYNYSTNIYNAHALNYYRKYRNNGYEQKYPHRDFKHRTSQVNKYDYDRMQVRSPQVVTGARPSSAQNAARPTENSRIKSNVNSTSGPVNSSGVRPISSASTVRPSSSNSAKPANTNATVRTATSRSAAGTSSFSNSRPTATNSTVRPSISSSTPRQSNYSNIRPTTTNSSAAKSSTTTSQYKAGSNTQSAPQRNASTSQRPATVNQNSQQRSSNSSAQRSQTNPSSRTSSSGTTTR